MEVAFGGSWPRPSLAFPAGKAPGDPLLPEERTQSQTCLWSQNSCRGVGGWIHTPGSSQAPKRRDPVLRIGASRRGGILWKRKPNPSLWDQHQPDKGEVKRRGERGILFFLCNFWEVSSCQEAPPAGCSLELPSTARAPAALLRPGRRRRARTA